ncbi:MAG TPA: hypothetical protein VJY15_08640 [Candidatus Acidoferrum sp.]|nr:hypothetical protein [Candidatus Acidoferrum sp.]
MKPNPKSAPADLAALLAQRLAEALLRERIVPRFVDSYVVEYGRFGLQVHAALYRDLLTLLQREALLAMSARALEIADAATAPGGAKVPASARRKFAAAFQQKYLAALARRQGWNAGDALEFQADLQMYQALLAKAGPTRRARKPFEVANHPFVDRCAFLLDSSFLEKARVAASRALTGLETLTTEVAQGILQVPSDARTPITR